MDKEHSENRIEAVQPVISELQDTSREEERLDTSETPSTSDVTYFNDKGIASAKRHHYPAPFRRAKFITRQPDCRVWYFSPRSRVRKAQAVHFQVRKIIFRCGKIFAGKAQVRFGCGALRFRW